MGERPRSSVHAAHACLLTSHHSLPSSARGVPGRGGIGGDGADKAVSGLSTYTCIAKTRCELLVMSVDDLHNVFKVLPGPVQHEVAGKIALEFRLRTLRRSISMRLNFNGRLQEENQDKAFGVGEKGRQQKEALRLQTHWSQRRARRLANFQVPLTEVLPRLFFARTPAEFRASGISRAEVLTPRGGRPSSMEMNLSDFASSGAQVLASAASIGSLPLAGGSPKSAKVKGGGGSSAPSSMPPLALSGVKGGAAAAAGLGEEQMRALQESIHGMVARAIQQQMPSVDQTVRQAIRAELASREA